MPTPSSRGPRSASARPDPSDDDDTTPGAWVLATYHCYFSVSINFICQRDGRPMHDWGPTSDLSQVYRWNSYHAARKFQRSHPELRGYVILNLAEIAQQCRRQRAIEDERVASLRSAQAAEETAAGGRNTGRTR